MTGLVVNGEKILTDQFGYLVHSADWHEQVATKIAKDEALILIKDHKKSSIINRAFLLGFI